MIDMFYVTPWYLQSLLSLFSDSHQIEFDSFDGKWMVIGLAVDRTDYTVTYIAVIS